MTAFASRITISEDRTDKVCKSRIRKIKDVVGNTPLTQVETLSQNKILAKLEYYNPFSLSVKDRTAVYMLTGPLEREEIDPAKDAIWIEASSGNLGIAYGKIGKFLGLKTMVVTPSIVGDVTFKRVMANATFTETTPGGYCPRGERDGALKKVMDTWLTNPSKYVWRDQYSNEDNIKAHEETTGPEIWKQTKGKITALVVATGTGGTIIGAARYLKKKDPRIEVIAVEPQVNHHVQGVRNYQESMKPLIIKENEDLIDEWVEIKDKEAFEATKLLWGEGYPVGTSSGLNYAASRIIAKRQRNGLVATVFPDALTNSFRTMQSYILSGKIEDV